MSDENYRQLNLFLPIIRNKFPTTVREELTQVQPQGSSEIEEEYPIDEMEIYRGDEIKIMPFHPLPDDAEAYKYCKLIINKGKFVRYKDRLYGMSFINPTVLEQVLVEDFTEDLETEWERRVQEYNNGTI